MSYQIEKLTKIQAVTLAELLAVWESSVRETHLFLAENDIREIKREVEAAFLLVDLYVVRVNGQIKAFLGVNQAKIEMLFVHADCRSRGIGAVLLKHALGNLQVKYVDVNEQNEQGRRFYEHFEFAVFAKSALDSSGRPFPVLHLQIADLAN